MTKVLIAVSALFFGGQCMASGTSAEEEELKKKENREILSPEMDKLFEEGRLAETIFKPIYTTTDQLVNTVIVKKALKKED